METEENSDEEWRQPHITKAPSIMSGEFAIHVFRYGKGEIILTFNRKQIERFRDEIDSVLKGK